VGWGKNNRPSTVEISNLVGKNKSKRQKGKFFLYKNVSFLFFDKIMKQREKKKKSAKQFKKWKQNSKPHGNNNR
jgi:hypothetical protein